MPKPVSRKTALIVNAIRFVKKVHPKRANLSILEKHVRLHNGFATCFDGDIAMSHPIGLDLEVCPQTHELSTALTKCGSGLTFSTTKAESLRIEGKKQTVIMQCANPSAFAFVEPDPHTLAVNDYMIEALQKVAVIVDDKNDKIVLSNVCIDGPTCCGVNASVILQSYHGFNIGERILVSKKAVKILIDVGKKLSITHIGRGQNSLTFYYDNGAWIKIYNPEDNYPNVNDFLNIKTDLKPINSEFFKGITHVLPFCNFGDGVYFNDGVVYSCSHEGEGSKYNIGSSEDGLFYGYNMQYYGGEYFKAVSKYVDKIDFTSHPTACYIEGNNFRGLIHKVTGSY